MDITHTAERLGLAVEFQFLQAGLHEQPARLRKELQAAIDTISADGNAARIVIGYGICGRGTTGIQSRGIPLVIPKVHDCIAILLGGADIYRSEFRRYPGTYYISAGWYEEKAVPISQRNLQAWYGDTQLRRADIARQYGDQVADNTIRFLNTWQKNYQRAAYIDTGTRSGSSAEAYAKKMARAYGWQYERIPGSTALIEKILTGNVTTPDILVVPPHHSVEFDAVTGTLTSNPLWASGPGKNVDMPLILDDEESLPPPSARIGLGIDAGGTYTDAVIYDFKSGETRCKAKALTTRWDFTIGIDRALKKLAPDLLARADMVALSTTLATNAIVEGDGQKVGLLLMPPYGMFNPHDFPHAPKAVVPGRLSISGQEVEPVNEKKVRRVVRRMADVHQVSAFAVSGFAGAINPDHEMTVKRIVHSETGLLVTCGHELSAILDFKIRATTAILNARIIPRLGKLIADLEEILARRGLQAPIVIVKGDGTLMQAAMAKERPVETIFSGPAASVAGARHLTGIDDALVVDVGGTTTDTASLTGGHVRVCETGSTVAGRRTHVRALDIRTFGLGGDSHIIREKGIFSIGPRRVAPIAWLGANFNGVGKAVAYVERRVQHYQRSTRNMQLLAAIGGAAKFQLTDMEQRIVSLLDKRPHAIDELVHRLEVLNERQLPLKRLEASFLVQRCGMTPTDLLHVAGRFRRWDSAMAGRFLRLMAGLHQIDASGLQRELLEMVSRNLALEIFKRQLDDDVDPEALHNCPVCQTLVGNVFAGGNANYRLRMKFKRPLIGIGAPVALFLPRAAEMIGARIVLPDHADVANAVGAVISKVVIERQVRIVPGNGSEFLIEGIAGSRRFNDFEAADAFAKRALVSLVRTLALKAGTSARAVTIDTEDQLPEDAGGHPIFIGRILRARLTGPPDRVDHEIAGVTTR
jgi:N-methylhydantoinase A/oxoprolinase/acetone carboxylase beta subunit